LATQGFNKLDAQLKSLADAVGPRRADKVLRSSLRFAMTPSKKAAAAKAPVGTQMHKTYKGRMVAPGFLSRNLQVAVTKVRNGKAAALLGPRKEAYYGTQFLERGTSKISPAPWLEPAFEATKGIALQRFAAKLAQNIEKERKK
jgi:HK97 gp10 family phage protein